MLMHKLPSRHQLPFELQHCSHQFHVRLMHMYVRINICIIYEHIYEYT